MKLSEKLNKKINEALDDMIQCVIKIEDVGNEYKYLGMIEDNSNYASEYDMEVEYEDADLGHSTIQYILAYHKEGDNKHFFDENGEEYDIEGINESLNEGKLFYLGWRGNPQLKDGGYYKKLGQLTKKEAKDWEKCSYGSMTLKSFESEDEYNQAIEKAKEEGKSVR